MANNRKQVDGDTVLTQCQEQFQALKEALVQLNWFCKGTVLGRKRKCGRPTCPCATDPKSLHGPYFEWTYKKAGNTVFHRLSEGEAKIYAEATAEYRKLKKLLRRMEAVSRRGLAHRAATTGKPSEDR
jgi:hypothetical protein